MNNYSIFDAHCDTLCKFADRGGNILKNEYNVDIINTPLPYQYVRWVTNSDINLKTLNLSSDTKKVQDLKGNYLLLFCNEWGIRWASEKNKDLQLAEFSKN